MHSREFMQYKLDVVFRLFYCSINLHNIIVNKNTFEFFEPAGDNNYSLKSLNGYQKLQKNPKGESSIYSVRDIEIVQENNADLV